MHVQQSLQDAQRTTASPAATALPVTLAQRVRGHPSHRGASVQEAEALAEDLADLENIDDRGIRRVVAGLERRVKKNTELRIKHADAPERFMDSELEVDEIVRKLLALAGDPELYTQLVAHGSVPLLLDLLHHANLDIVCAAVDLLQELLDSDVVEDLETVRARPAPPRARHTLCARQCVCAWHRVFAPRWLRITLLACRSVRASLLVCVALCVVPCVHRTGRCMLCPTA